MVRSFAASLAFISLAAVAASITDYNSVKRKFQLIESEKAAPGSTVSVSAREVNAYVETEVRKLAPEGISKPQVSLGKGTAEGRANIDFLKIRKAQGEAPGWLMTQLLEGEHPVFVKARLTSSSGRAQVDIERVEVDGVGVEGRVLDYLIKNHVRAYFPKAKVGESFPLLHGIERLDVQPHGVNVVMAKK
jgi:hypothetical protein